MADLRGAHILGGAALAAAVLLGFCAVRMSGGTGEAHVTEDAAGTPTPLAPVLLPDEHVAGIMYTAHRYPRVVGQEVTTVIHSGYSMASVPRSPESFWLTRPPSELVL